MLPRVVMGGDGGKSPCLGLADLVGLPGMQGCRSVCCVADCAEHTILLYGHIQHCIVLPWSVGAWGPYPGGP